MDPRDRHCRIANRAMRMVFQLVVGRQVWRGKGVDREAVLSKLREFHRDHQTDLSRMIGDMNEAFRWRPRHTYSSEARPLAELAGKQRRGPQPIGDILMGLADRVILRAKGGPRNDPIPKNVHGVRKGRYRHPAPGVSATPS